MLIMWLTWQEVPNTLSSCHFVATTKSSSLSTATSLNATFTQLRTQSLYLTASFSFSLPPIAPCSFLVAVYGGSSSFFSCHNLSIVHIQAAVCNVVDMRNCTVLYRDSLCLSRARDMRITKIFVYNIVICFNCQSLMAILAGFQWWVCT